MDKQLLPVFVMYTYQRLCYRNPSMERFSGLPQAMQRDVIRAMEGRKGGRRAKGSVRAKVAEVKDRKSPRNAA